MTVQTLGDIRDLAQQLRVDSIRCSTAAGSGHPTSSMSAADVMAVLLARHFRYDWQRPDDPANDHLIFSKGHASPVLYGPDEAFPVGGSKVVRSSPGDQVTLAGAGVTLHNCLAAADQLGRDGIRARVLDLYSVKPIGSAALEAFNDAGHPARIVHLAVRGLPGSGTAGELMEAAGTSAGHVAQAARELLSQAVA